MRASTKRCRNWRYASSLIDPSSLRAVAFRTRRLIFGMRWLLRCKRRCYARRDNPAGVSRLQPALAMTLQERRALHVSLRRHRDDRDILIMLHVQQVSIARND